ncbi:MAG: lysophospholipid acyltransferase family protein [Deltaproteobacteria bacterium]
MDSKKIRTSVSRFLAWLGLNFCSLVIKFIPARYIYDFAENMGSLAYRFAVKQRNIAMESLSIAFEGQKTRQQMEQIARDCFILMAKSGTELIFLMDRPQLLKQKVAIRGKEHLERAISQGKGVILVSAHFGNFPLLLARLSVDGYKVAGIMRNMRDARVEKIFRAKRERFKIKTIYSQPRKVCVETTIKLLRGNGIVFIPIDQNFGSGGVFVDFFGRKAATATGPVVLAQRTGASIIPCFIIRQRDNAHEIIFEPALDLKKAQTPEEIVAVNIQELTCIIESYIRRYPAEWGWIHKRWKSRPN